MTDTEIVKALECCKSSLQICRADCPLLSETECSRALRENVLDLINRQKAEIERLKEKNESLETLVLSYGDCVTKTRAEAIREFTERLNKKYLFLFGPHDTYSFTRKWVIEEIIKEMTEDSNE